MKRRAFVSFLLIISIVIQSITFLAFAEENIEDGVVASAYLGKTLKGTKMNVFSNERNVFPIAEREGKEGWVMKSDWKLSWLICDVDSSVVNGNAESKNYDVEIEYYDEGNGHFCLTYLSSFGGESKVIESDKVSLKNDLCWKTVTITMQCPAFDTSLNGGDFRVITRSEYWGFSKTNVIISSVKVRERKDVSTVGIKVSSPVFGNNFFTGEELDFDIEFNNTENKTVEVDVIYEVFDEYKTKAFTKTEKMTLKPGITKHKFNEEFEYYGMLDFNVTVRCEEKNIYSTQKEYFSYNYSSNGKFVNDKFGYTCHWRNNNYKKAMDEGIPMARKAGVGWMRDELPWRDVEKEKGVLSTPPEFRFVDIMEENDINLYFLIASGNKFYDGEKSVPYTEEGLEGWKRYCAYMTEQVKGKAEWIEVWNEYNHAWFNDNFERANNEHYYTLLKYAYEGIRSVDKDIKIAGFCTAGIVTGLYTTVFEMGGAEMIDAISYHNYYHASPNTVSILRDHQTVRNIADRYKPELETWFSETGYTSVKTDMAKHAPYDVQAFVLSQENNTLDCYIIYEYICSGVDPNNSEANFGALECSSQQYREPFGARPAFVANSAMCNIMGTPDYVSKISAQDNTTFAFRFKRTQDNKDVAVMWSSKPSAYMAIDFGKDDLEVYDMYGNKLNPYHKNGVYSFNIGDEPVYVVGDFEKFEESAPDIDISDVSIKAPIGETVVITAYKNIEEDMDIEVTFDEYSKTILLEEPKFVGNKAEIKLKVNSSTTGKSEILNLRLHNGDSTYYNGKISIEYVDALEVSGKTRQYKIDDITRWVLDLEIKSNYYTSSPDGKMTITGPSDFANLIAPIKIEKIKPQETKKLSIHLPKINKFTSYWFNSDILMNNNDLVKTNFTIDFAVAAYAKNKPTIDGKIEAGEYNSRTALNAYRFDQVYELQTPNSWKGEKDLSFKSYIMWDEEYLYLASEVTDDVFCQPYTGTNIWQGDCVQAAFAYAMHNNNTASRSYTEMGVAKSNNGEITMEKWNVETNTDPTNKNTICGIERIGDKTGYEIRIPWTEIVPEGEVVKNGTKIGFSMLVNDDDTYGRRGWIEFGSGVGRTKDVSQFATIYLTDLTN